jgi:hypothetical protein
VWRVSHDAVAGVSHKKKTHYDRVRKKFDELTVQTGAEVDATRTNCEIENHWKSMQTDTLKFYGFFAITSQEKSGWEEEA